MKKQRKTTKKQKLSEEELKKLKEIEESKEDVKNEILFRTIEEDKKKKKERDQKKEDEINDLTGGAYKKHKSFNLILLKSAVFRNVTFIEAFYDHLFRMTGLKKDENNPHHRPNIFAEYTIKYIYRRFNIRNLMDELRDRNPSITAESMRDFKHYQFFNEENYVNLLCFIKDFIQYCDEHPTPLFQFDIDYCKHYNLTTDGDMFYNE
jgi:P63C domain